MLFFKDMRKLSLLFAVVILCQGLPKVYAGAMSLDEPDDASPETASLDEVNPDFFVLASSEEICREMSGFTKKWDFYGKIAESKTFYKSLREAYLKLQAHKMNNHQEEELINGYMREFQQKLAQQEELIDDISMCAFKEQLQVSLKANLNNSKNTEFLEQIKNVGTCIENRGGNTEEVKGLFGGTFDAIFNFFNKKKNLTDEDCEVLKRTYEVWSSFQEEENNTVANNRGPQVPVYNVNPHNSSFSAWLKEKEKGTIPAGGLPTIHLDTHTDLGHVHSHGSGWSSEMNLQEISRLVVIENDDDFIGGVRRSLESRGTSTERINEVIGLGAPALREQIFNQMRDRVHNIAQPLVAGLATEVTSDLIMALPPWSFRLPRSEAGDPFKVNLVNTGPRGYYGLSTTEGEILKARGTPISLRGDSSDPLSVRTFDMAVVDANLESLVETRNDDGEVISTMIERRPATRNDSLLAHMPQDQNQFILDIDLDAFVSEGRGLDGTEPRSFGRHVEQYGTHNGHDVNTETDPNVQIPLREFELIEERLEDFFGNLEEMKAAGKLPAVITIADSTLLQSMAGADPDDSQVGGNYTPECMAFLLNYRIRQKLKELYNTTIQD